jgi:hypothetical protein
MKDRKKLVGILLIVISFVLMILDIHFFRHLRGGAVMIEFIFWLMFVMAVADYFSRSPSSKGR